jgi:hypothetical protein
VEKQQEMPHQYVIEQILVGVERKAGLHHVWVGIYQAMLI